MADNANEEGRAKALKYYKIMAGLQGMLGVGMLICGIIATVNYDEDVFGPPYFVGGYVVGIMALIASMVCTCVIMKVPDANSDVKKQELGCALQCHYMLSMFMIMGCFIGTVLAGIGGFAFSEDLSSTNKTLAVIILLGCIFGVFLTICSLCIVCTYGRYLGIVITQGRRGRMMIVNTNATGGTQFGVVETNQFFQTNPNMGATNAQISQLERQNQLLQQQLDLQRQLNEQQQQQQQYGGGFSEPPPPPMYNSSPGYPPTAPPPSYDDVK